MPETTTGTGDVRERVVAAADHLMRTAGATAVTTRAVAEAAGVQVPTIYRLFGDKDGLLDAVAEHAMATYVTQKTAAVATEGREDPVETLRRGWDANLDFGLANPDLFHLLLAPRRGRTPAVEAGLAVLRTRVHRLAAARRLQVSEDRAVALVHAAGTGVVTTLLATPPDERDPGLRDAAWTTTLHAILDDPPPSADVSATGTVVAFAAQVDELPGLTDAERALMVEWTERVTQALQEG